jgi:hypothetical protein
VDRALYPDDLLADILMAASYPLDVVEAARWHCQSKFYTACSRTRAGWSSTVFARELPPRSAEFNAENRLYSFALTMPVHDLDEDHEAAGALDQNALDVVRSAAAMARQRRPRSLKQPSFLGAAVELRQHMRPAVRT